MQSSILLRENAVPELHVHRPLLKHFAYYSTKNNSTQEYYEVKLVQFQLDRNTYYNTMPLCQLRFLVKIFIFSSVAP